MPQFNFIGSILYTVCLGTTKLSLLFLFLRISPGRFYRTCVLVMIYTVVAYASSALIAVIVQCTPIRMAWDLTITDGHCMDRPRLSFAGAVLNIAFDFVIFFLPMPTVWNLQLPWRQKLALMMVFGVGLLYILPNFPTKTGDGEMNH